MNKEEYEKVKNYTYDEYCNYLKQKYGEIFYTYGSQKNNKSDDGLFIHHIKENIVASLSNPNISKENNPEYQGGKI